ncbi:MAG TPA: hypothetical protein VFG76_00630 [Candidatus Polarisedimenticolia bacterium]|nr:hypothetical protein [Candidatus Polarisedimenticolia bacterium]
MRDRMTPLLGAFGLLTVLGGAFAMPVFAESTRVSRPVLIQSVDEKGRVPYMQFEGRACPGGDALTCVVEFPPVPAGRRLVLEYVNASINFATGGVRRTGLLAPEDFIVVLPTHPILDPNLVIVNEPTLVYYESGQSPIFQLVPNAANDVPLVTVVLSGYLVNLN